MVSIPTQNCMLPSILMNRCNVDPINDNIIVDVLFTKPMLLVVVILLGVTAPCNSI